jgi:hypothetical protein
MTEQKTGGKSANPLRKATKALRQAQVTSTKVKSGKYSPKNPNSSNPTPQPQSVKSPVEDISDLLEEISDLLDTPTLRACVELTRRLLTAAPTPPFGAARSWAVLKIVVLFVAKYGSTA